MAAKISGYLPVLLQILAPKMKVDLVFGNISTGSATKDQVVITNEVLCMTDQVKAEKIALGLLCHEGLGHVRQTDWKAWIDFCKKTPAGKGLLNIIEDARVERNSWVFYPGVKRMLHDVCEVFIQDGKLTISHQDTEPGDVIIAGLLHILRGEYLEQGTNAKLGRELMANTFGQQLAAEVIDLALKGAAAKTTQEAADFALAILEKLKQSMASQADPCDQNLDQQDQQGSSGNSKDGDPGDEQQNVNQGNDQSQGQNDKPVPGEKSDGLNGGENDENQDSNQSKLENIAKALEQMQNGQIAETDMANVLRGIASNEKKQSAYGADSTPIYGKIHTVEPKGEKRIPGTEVLTASRRMAARLEQLLAARIDDDDRLAYSGELNGNLAARIRLLDTQVFMEEGDETDGIDSSVLLLVDASSSMMSKIVKGGINRSDLCFNAVYASASAMAKFKPNGVEMAIWSYNDKLTKFVDFGNWSFQKDRFCQYAVEGGTSTFPACVEAIGALARQRQKRKHLVVFSDGDLGGEPTEKHLREAAKAGIEVSIIFIGDKNIAPATVSKTLKEHVYIVHDTDSIVSAMFSCLKPR